MTTQKTGTDRFTAGFVAEIKTVLERNGYQLPEGRSEGNAAMGRAIAALLDLTSAFEGGESELGALSTVLRLTEGVRR